MRYSNSRPLVCFNNRWVENLVLRRGSLYDDTICVGEVFRLLGRYGWDHITGLVGILEDIDNIEVMSYKHGEFIGVHITIVMDETLDFEVVLGDEVINEIYCNSIFPHANVIHRHVEHTIVGLVIEFISVLCNFKNLNSNVLMVEGCIDTKGTLSLMLL